MNGSLNYTNQWHLFTAAFRKRWGGWPTAARHQTHRFRRKCNFREWKWECWGAETEFYFAEDLWFFFFVSSMGDLNVSTSLGFLLLFSVTHITIDNLCMNLLHVSSSRLSQLPGAKTTCPNKSYTFTVWLLFFIYWSGKSIRNLHSCLKRSELNWSLWWPQLTGVTVNYWSQISGEPYCLP